MKIVGVTIAKGVYEGNNYHNVNFQGTEPFDNDKGAGLKVKAVKVKYSVLSEIVGKQPTDKEVYAFVGKDAKFFYDEYKSVTYIQGLTP